MLDLLTHGCVRSHTVENIPVQSANYQRRNASSLPALKRQDPIISHTVLRGSTQPSEVVCEMRLPICYTLSSISLLAEYTNSSVVGKPLSKLVASSRGEHE
jgi:hypothetical protein